MGYIEQCLGDEWPKKLYPHGAGREWSTSMYDDWKADLGFEVVPASQFRGAVDLLREIGEMAGAKANGADARAMAKRAREFVASLGLGAQ